VLARFTGGARQVVVLAQEEAWALGHDHIGTGHLLLGLLREGEGAAGAVLRSAGLGPEGVRARVVELAVPGGRGAAEGQVRFGPKAKKALELALREAIALGHEEIGAEHVLLGLLRADDGAAAAILRGHGAEPERLREAVLATAPARPRGARRRGRRRSFAELLPGRTRWEYRLETPAALDAAWLNELGDEGWELTAVVPGAGAPTYVFRRRCEPPGALRRAG